MGLRDKLNRSANANTSGSSEERHFSNFGIVDNPFPSSSQTQGHPHLESEADDNIVPFIETFDSDKSSQVLVIEGDQGTGKTNILNYYEAQFKELYDDNDGFYIIRYYADPEPGFDKMLARIFEELGSQFVQKIGTAISDSSNREEIVGNARTSDMRIVLQSLGTAAGESEDRLKEVSDAAIEWILGFRLLKRHRELLGQIHFRLDTVESKTQALRDLVYCGVNLNVLNGLILLLDELEKTGGTTSKMTILRFLSSIRALIDALPKYMFLMAAMTPDARSRYFEMLPAFAGRLQNRIELPYLQDESRALKLYAFYLDEARKRAEAKMEKRRPGHAVDIVTKQQAAESFREGLDEAKRRGDAGVRQRDYLNTLHRMAGEKLTNPTQK